MARMLLSGALLISLVGLASAIHAQAVPSNNCDPLVVCNPGGSGGAGGTVTLINFEKYPDGTATKLGDEINALKRNYNDWSVVLETPTGFSLKIVTPAVGTHSPNHALGLYAGGANTIAVYCSTICWSPARIIIKFIAANKRAVSLFAGLHSKASVPVTATLVAFDAQGRYIPIAGSQQAKQVGVGIQTALSVTSNAANIARVELYFTHGYGTATIPLPDIDDLSWTN